MDITEKFAKELKDAKTGERFKKQALEEYREWMADEMIEAGELDDRTRRKELFAAQMVLAEYVVAKIKKEEQ